MAIDTFMVFVGVYADVDSATQDYELVKDLHSKAGLIDAYDAAVVVRRGMARSRSSPSTRHPRGSEAFSAAASVWQPAWLWRCFRSRRSAVACSPPARPAARLSAHWPDTPQQG
jgi:hypothetical protein